MAKLPTGLNVYTPPQFENLSETSIAIGVHSSGNTIYKKILKFKTPSTTGQASFSIGSMNILDFKGIVWWNNNGTLCQCPLPWVYRTELITFCTNRQNGQNYLNLVILGSGNINLNCIVEVTYY